MSRRFGANALLCAVASLAALPGLASARTHVVYVGGPPAFQNNLQSKYGGSVNDFFPHRDTIHVGDTVSWQGMDINFHSVDLPKNGQGRLPLFIPSSKTAAGTLDFAGVPFWYGGPYSTVPELTFNPALLAPFGGHTYNGKSTVDAGLPFKPATFNVKFLKPGAYKYFCDVHYTMQGFIIVKPKKAHIPSAKQEAAAVAKQVKTDAAIAAALVKTSPAPNNVSLGATGKHNVEILAMFPSSQTVKAGTTVLFSMPKLTGEPHTGTFGPLSDFLTTGPNAPGLTPTGYLGVIEASIQGAGPIDPRLNLPSSPPGTPIPVSPTSHGNGYANTGVLDRNPLTTQVPPASQVTFTTPGTYRFVCMIHPFMQAVVNVVS